MYPLLCFSGTKTGTLRLRMVRPTGIELVSSAPQADTLSIELWAQKKDICNAELLTTFLF